MRNLVPGKNWVFKVGQRIVVDQGSYGLGCVIEEVKDKGQKFVVSFYINGKKILEEVNRNRLRV